MQIRQGLDNSSSINSIYKYISEIENITLDHGHEGEKILCNMHRRVNFEAMGIRLWDMLSPNFPYLYYTFHT